MPEFLEHHPGLLFVIATLLPLASFVLLLLVGGLRNAVRRAPEGSVGATLYRALGGPLPGRGAAYVATAAIGLACVCSVIGFVLFTTGHAAHEHKAEKLQAQIRTLRLQRSELEHKHKAGAETKPEKLPAPKGEGAPGEAPAQGKVSAGPKAEAAAAQAQKGPEAAKQKKREQLTRDIEAKEMELQALEGEWKGRVPWAWVGAADNEKQPGTLLTVGYRIDSLAALMFVMVSFVATLIHVFSIGYMGDELKPEVEDHVVPTGHGHLHRSGRFGRFFLFMSLFCFSMLNLVLADNLFQVFVSWELVGLCS